MYLNFNRGAGMTEPAPLENNGGKEMKLNRKWLTAILLIALCIPLIIAGVKDHERGLGRIELGDVTADDAWVSGKNWFVPGAGMGGVILRGASFLCEGYDGTTGNYEDISDSTVFFTLSLECWGADTCTLATYCSYEDTLTAATEYVPFTISAKCTVKVGDVMVINFQETDTSSGVLAIRACVIMFEYDKY